MNLRAAEGAAVGTKTQPQRDGEEVDQGRWHQSGFKGQRTQILVDRAKKPKPRDALELRETTLGKKYRYEWKKEIFYRKLDRSNEPMPLDSDNEHRNSKTDNKQYSLETAEIGFGWYHVEK